MGDGLIFPYRWGTARADWWVLTHAGCRLLLLPRVSARAGGGGVLVWGSSALVGKRVNRGDAQW